MRKDRVPVTRRAMLQRLKRILARQGETLKAHPGRPGDEPGIGERHVGRYFIVTDGKVTRRDVDVEALARKVGALQPYEELVDL